MLPEARGEPLFQAKVSTLKSMLWILRTVYRPGNYMRHIASEKVEIIHLVEQSEITVREYPVREFYYQPS